MAIFTRTITFVLLLTITIPYFVLSYPYGAGTCDVTKMSTDGHGAPRISGAGGYSLAVSNSTTASGGFTITVKGSKAIEGLLIYTQDSKGSRTGNFVVPSKFQSKSCSGTGTNTLTQLDSSSKSMPLSLSWSPSSDSVTNFTVRALVVLSYNDWYQLGDLTFDTKSGSVDTSTPVVSPSTDDNSSGSGSGENTFLQQYSLFIVVISITAALYIIGSFVEMALRRQQVKARVLARAVGGFGQ